MKVGLFVLLVAAFGAVGCATYSEDLNRGQRMYEENEYEKALALWRVLEGDQNSLSGTDQGRYTYLRGMTDYRLGYRSDARHWLAIATASEQQQSRLSGEWKERMALALADLNRDVYGGERFDTSRTIAVERSQSPLPEAPSDGPSQALPAVGGCRSNAECGTSMICVDQRCVPP